MPLKRKGLSAAVYTQTTDVEGEVNGLMTYDRSVTKINAAKLARINAGYVAPSIGDENRLFLESWNVKIQNELPSGEIRYTLDGSDPTKNSAVYKEPLTIQKTAVVKARTFWTDGSFSPISEATFEKVRLHKGKAPKELSKGLAFSYYKNEGPSWSSIPDWKTLKPDSSGVVETPGIKLIKRDSNFGFVYEGFIRFEKPGIYSFFLESDDGSKLLIDNVPVIEHNGIHGMVEKKGEIGLASGFHNFRLEYFQGTGGKGLSLKVNGPGMIKKQAVTADMLFNAIQK
jgi:hypothetical protein